MYGSNIPPPKTNIHLDMPRFSVGLTPEFADLVSSGRIALLTGADVVGADDKAVILTMADGDGSERRVRCGAIIAATGFKGSGKEFLSGELRDDLGLTRQPLRDGWRDRVKTIRKRWGSFRPTGPIEDREIDLPLVYRGIVPIGRYDERDLVVAGGSTSESESRGSIRLNAISVVADRDTSRLQASESAQNLFEQGRHSISD